MKRHKGDTFELGGCLWLVEKEYKTDNPDLFYTDRITIKCNAYIAKCFEMGLFDNLEDDISKDGKST